MPNLDLSPLDAATLKQLAAAGANLNKETEVVNYLYFPKEKDAKRAAEDLGRCGFLTRQGPSAASDEYLIVAETKLVPSAHNVAEMRRTLETIAARFGGDYDGWEAAVTQ